MAQDRPKIVVGITINQFYPEWLDLYSKEMSDGGFKRILKQKSLTADYNYMFSQRGVDQATLSSGVYPSTHGIVSDVWYNRLSKKVMNMALSTRYRSLGGQNAYSPDNMSAFTIASALKLNNADSKIYSIGVDPETAVMGGGASADLAVWYSGNTGRWCTSSYYKGLLPTWISNFNIDHDPDELIEKNWSSNNENKKFKNFNYNLKKLHTQMQSYDCIKATPYVNTMVTELAQYVLENAMMGIGSNPDLLMLNFNCLDYLNRTLSINSLEFHDEVLSLDKDLEKLFTLLDKKFGANGYTLFLTFSEAKELLPDDLDAIKVRGGYFSMFKAISLLKSYLNISYKIDGLIKSYDSGQIYLDRDLIERHSLSLEKVQKKVALFLSDFEGVANVVTASNLAVSNPSEGNAILLKNSYVPQRSGDVLFSLKPTWIPALEELNDFYNCYSKRHKVPIYFMGKGVAKIKTKYCKIIDILPTICAICKIPIPYSAEGKSLLEDRVLF